MTDTDETGGFRALEPEELADLFPQYEIEYLIATGGMGAVYKAVQKSLDREVAIKVLPEEFAQDINFCAQFEAEAKAMGRLNHPNLIGVYDFGEVAGMLFIVMEFVEGHSLHDAYNGQALKSSDVLALMHGICSGLAHAHEHGILHRDIKPANIMLDGHGQPKIGDFGLARPVDHQVGEGEMIFGTPGYTAPEVLEPPHAMDHRTDIFALGVLMYELLNGQLPGEGVTTLTARVRCHPRIDAVVRTATQPNPDQRFQSVGAMTDELAKVGKTPGTRPATSALTVGGRPASSAPTVVATAPAGASLAPAGGGLAFGGQSAAGQGGALGGGQPGLASATSSGNSGMTVILLILVVVAVLLFLFRGSLMDAVNGTGDDDKPQGPGLDTLVPAPLDDDPLAEPGSQPRPKPKPEPPVEPPIEPPAQP